MRRRSRACENCHRLKIKCDTAGSPDRACERCHRNQLRCVASAPRLQRDRISELELQVEELEERLRAAQTTISRATIVTDRSDPSCDVEIHNNRVNNSDDNTILSFLDAHISLSTQQELLRVFQQDMETTCPVVNLPSDLLIMRAKSPVLLLTVLAHTTTQGGVLGFDLQDKLVQQTLEYLGHFVVGKGQRSLELVQALLITTFWTRPTRTGLQGTCYQIIQMAVEMAIDIGIGVPMMQPSPSAYFSSREDATTLEARRTWLACFMGISVASISTRRPIALAWNVNHQECVMELERGGHPPDILFCQIVRITRLIQEVSGRFDLCRQASYVNGNETDTHLIINSFMEQVNEWVEQIPPALAQSHVLRLWQHVAVIYIHEVVLHTPTNKGSFAAPFIPEKIVVKDFPAPNDILPELGPALETVINHCHMVINTAAEMDPFSVLSLSTFCFPPMVLYSLFVLVNLLVATTDPMNTYGRCGTRLDFRIDECCDKLRILAARLTSLDPASRSYSVRLFRATAWIKEWHDDYTAILHRYDVNTAHLDR